MRIRPALAKDAVLDTIRYPCAVESKIDGVRALNLGGAFTGRSLELFEGFGLTEYFSRPEFEGLDGELTVGTVPNSSERLCSLTTGAVGRFKGVTEMADFHWWIFDFVTPATLTLPYRERYKMAAERIEQLRHPRLHLVPLHICSNREELDTLIALHANAGYEGTIIRNLEAPYKEGRPTLRGQELMRVKPWVDFEIRITNLLEGNSNENHAQTNALGYTERSSSQAGLVPNGQVGAVQGTLLADLWVNNKTHCIKAGTLITAGSGNMTEMEAAMYWNTPELLLGQIGKIKTMAFGVKNLPRFAIFTSLRLPQDL